MATTPEIKEMDAVMKQYLHNNNKKILSFKTRRLTQAGENYGSLIVGIELQIQNDDSTEETLHLVGKMCPPNEWIKKMFNIPATFKKEIAFYSVILPTYKKFQEEHNISNLLDTFPNFFGGRTSLDPTSSVVDDDALLLLENLQIKDYITVDRMLGFDLETSKLVIKRLAVFHAIPLAIKLKDPKLFKEYILPYTKKESVFEDIPDDVRDKMVELIVTTASSDPDCIPVLDNVRKCFLLGEKNMRESPKFREPYATVCHNDFWSNNAMIKYDGNCPVDAKLIDLQIMDYRSSANDLVFFLYSSIQIPVLNEHFDALVKLYHETLINVLKLFKCDSSPFTYELLLKEMKIEAREAQFHHISMMLTPIYSIKGEVKDISELSADGMIDVKRSDKFNVKVCYVIKEFAKRNWL